MGGAMRHPYKAFLVMRRSNDTSHGSGSIDMNHLL